MTITSGLRRKALSALALATVGLTAAELEVLLSLPDGGSLDQIARSAGKSRNTIAGHVKGIYQKLGVASRTQALARAREMHLLG